MRELLTPQEVAQILRKDRRTVYSYIRSGELRAAKVGNDWRIRPEDLEAFIENRMSKQKDPDK
ncbi:MAG: helix-turn-helix domain-containing protein [Bacillota bacterium]